MCLSVCEIISGNTRDLYQIFMHVAYGRGLVLLRRRCDALRTSGFVHNVMFFFYDWPYSVMNFATKDPFRFR